MTVDSLIVNRSNTTCNVYTVAVTQDAIKAPVEGETLRLTAEPVFVDELSGNSTPVVGRDGKTSTTRLFFRGGTTINGTDHIAIGSDMYVLLDRVDNPHRFGHHVEVWVTLRK